MGILACTYKNVQKLTSVGLKNITKKLLNYKPGMDIFVRGIPC